MTDLDAKNLPVEVSKELTEEKFQQLNLQEIGLQTSDFHEVVAQALKNLAYLTPNAETPKGAKSWKSDASQQLLLCRLRLPDFFHREQYIYESQCTVCHKADEFRETSRK